MSHAATAGFRAVSFGALDGSLWGAAVDGDHPALVLGGSGAGLAQMAGVAWSHGDADTWGLTGDGVTLTVTPIAPPAPDTATDNGAPSSAGVEGQQLCRVHGAVTLAGSEQPIDCVGTRIELPGSRDGPASGGQGATARLVSAWFSETEALTLVAVRPRAAEHQDADIVSSTLFDPDGWISVADPRLSTTYDAAGLPTRTSLELWIGEGENEFTRRAAGEVSGPGGSVAAGQPSGGQAGPALQVSPLRCHSRGHDGAGVYVLARF